MTNLKGNVPRFLYFPSLVFIADSCKILILDFKLLTEEIDANKVPCLLAGDREKFTVSKGNKKSWKRSLTTHILSIVLETDFCILWCLLSFHAKLHMLVRSLRGIISRSQRFSSPHEHDASNKSTFFMMKIKMMLLRVIWLCMCLFVASFPSTKTGSESKQKESKNKKNTTAKPKELRSATKENENLWPYILSGIMVNIVHPDDHARHQYYRLQLIRQRMKIFNTRVK